MCMLPIWPLEIFSRGGGGVYDIRSVTSSQPPIYMYTVYCPYGLWRPSAGGGWSVT